MIERPRNRLRATTTLASVRAADDLISFPRRNEIRKREEAKNCAAAPPQASPNRPSAQLRAEREKRFTSVPPLNRRSDAAIEM